MNYSGELPTFDDEGNRLTEGDRALNVNLSPEQQQSFDQNNQINSTLRGFAQNNLLPQVQQALNSPLNFNGGQQQRPNVTAATTSDQALVGQGIGR